MSSYYEKFLASGEVKCIDEEIPFEIPKGWEWCRLSHVTEVARGGSPRPIKDYITESSSGINWIKIGDTEKGGKFIFSTREKIKPEGVSKSRFVHKGDFLLTNSMSFGRPYITQVEGCIHDGWLVISLIGGAYCQDFLYYLLSSNFAYAQFSSKVAGAVVQNLNSDKVANSLFPIPPKTEQERIIKKIEEIFPKVYQYEELSNELASMNLAIRTKLKKSILQEAIQGKLVPQIAEEGTAEELLVEISKEKERLVKEGKLKKSALSDNIIFKGDDNKYYEQVGNTSRCIDEEVPFDIPSTWIWTRLSCIANVYTGNSISEAEKKSKFTNVKGRYYIGTKDVDLKNRITYNNGVAIPKQYESAFRIAPKSSVLMCIEGGSAGKKIAVLNQDVCFGNKLCCFAAYTEISKYVYYYLQSPIFLDMFNQYKTGIIGGVSIAKVKEILLPLPPLQEQQHIVAQIEKLFEQLK